MSTDTNVMEKNEGQAPVIDPKEFEVAKKESKKAKGVYTHKFKRPVKYNGQDIEELTFDFNKLSGKDCMAVEEELRMMNVSLVAPTFNGMYLIRMAARACTEKIGADIFYLMPAGDFTRIRSRTQSFFMGWE